ncbi:hypothetical protein JCM8097_006860 [Rhodosporidiobolus ruineniae]
MGKASEATDFYLPSYDEATKHSGPPALNPIEYHVYRAAGSWGFSLDDIVTGPDKQRILYYLDFPRTWSGRWDLTLRVGGPQGPPVGNIKKGAWRDSFDISMAANPQPLRCQRTGFFSARYEFGGNNNTEYYCWKPDGYFARSADYSLYKVSELDLPKEQRKVIAHWRTPTFSISKDGTLLIQPDHAFEQELILATALGVEERARENRQAGTVAAST